MTPTPLPTMLTSFAQTQQHDRTGSRAKTQTEKHKHKHDNRDVLKATGEDKEWKASCVLRLLQCYWCYHQTCHPMFWLQAVWLQVIIDSCCGRWWDNQLSSKDVIKTKWSVNLLTFYNFFIWFNQKCIGLATSVKRMKKRKRMFVRRIGFAEKGWNCFCKVQQDSTFRLLGAIGGGWVGKILEFFFSSSIYFFLKTFFLLQRWSPVFLATLATKLQQAGSFSMKIKTWSDGKPSQSYRANWNSQAISK